MCQISGTIAFMLTVTTLNLNGIRAAAKRGLSDWLKDACPDILLLQEVRATSEIATEILGEKWEVLVASSRAKGRSGVAVAIRSDWADRITGHRSFLDEEESDADSGRWLEVNLDMGGSNALTVVSAYFHSGEVGTHKQDEKMNHLARVGSRMDELLAQSTGVGSQVVVGGDFNVVRSVRDIKNWKPNHNKRAGVLDEEIVYLNTWVENGWHDIGRDLAGEAQGPYTWWSWRGQAFDNDAGWRIDYQYASPSLAALARNATVERASSYDARISDHAGVSVNYDLS